MKAITFYFAKWIRIYNGRTHLLTIFILNGMAAVVFWWFCIRIQILLYVLLAAVAGMIFWIILLALATIIARSRSILYHIIQVRYYADCYEVVIEKLYPNGQSSIIVVYVCPGHNTNIVPHEHLPISIRYRIRRIQSEKYREIVVE